MVAAPKKPVRSRVARSRVARPRVVPTPSDVDRARRTVRVVDLGAGKGRGLVAATDVPAMTPVGPYPGLVLGEAAYERRVAAGLTDGTYAVTMWSLSKDGRPRSDRVVDPGAPGGGVLPEFAAGVTPFANEPSADVGPNLVWVWNLPRGRMEMWTLRAVRAGEELTVCYGLDGGYARTYATSCVVRPGEVEPELHVVTTPRGKPVPWSSWT